MSATSLLWSVTAAATLALAGTSRAQLTPDRLYYGHERPMPMTVKAPAGVRGELTVQLLAPVSAEVVETAAVTPGGVDLAALFPALWNSESSPRLLYAQLAAGDTKVGPAVVLQPLVTPKYARFDPRGTTRPWSWYEPPMRAPAGYRAWVDQNVVLETTEGNIEVMMRPDAAPNTVFNFVHLVQGGFYSDIPVHRIADFPPQDKPSIFQVGDPSGTGEGGPGYSIDLEDSPVPHEFGVLSMARTPEPNSAGSQFFVCLDREAVVALDGNYTTFAQAISGADVITKIAASPADPATGKPANPPRIKTAKLVNAKPYEGVPPFLTPPDAPPTGDATDPGR